MMVEAQVAARCRHDDVRAFVLSASAEEVIERLSRLETRLVELDARLRAVRDIVDDAAL